jgi:hypothetical protein
MNRIRGYDSGSDSDRETEILKKIKVTDKEKERATPKRKRQVQHIVGNWPSLIYLDGMNCLPVELHFVTDFVDSVFLYAQTKLPGLQKIDQGLHISLSRPFYLKVFQIDPFVAFLERQLRSISKYHVLMIDFHCL